MGAHSRASVLGADQLIDAATDSTGLSDFGDEGWREGLDRLVRALTEEAALNEVGVAAAAKELKYLLIARLGIVAHRRNHPEVGAADVVPPVVIIGQAHRHHDPA